MLFFVDESGHPHPHDSTKHPVLQGVLIKETDIRQLTKDIHNLKDNIYNSQAEIKSTIINRRVFTKHQTKNKQYIDNFVDLICNYDITTFAVIMDLPVAPLSISPDHFPKQYELLMKRAEFYAQSYDAEKVLFIYDEQTNLIDSQISESFNNFLIKSSLGKSFTRILEMPLFVDSKIIPAIQIADVFAGITRQFYELNLANQSPSNDFETWILSLYNKIHARTCNLRQPDHPTFVEYGFYYMGSNF